MTLSIWRYAHLALAILSSAFLLILAVTGVILAYDAIEEKIPAYRIDNFEQISLAQSLPALRDNYFEILQLQVDHNDFVTIEAMDEEGNSIHSYINPITGEKLGKVVPKSAFIQWTTALHRSLFLKETGRTLVGIVSFLLFLITISGFILIVKRQKGIKRFFAKTNKDFFAQYFHVITGKWLLLPVLVIALTGTLIFTVRLDFFKKENQEIVQQQSHAKETVSKNLEEMAFFQNTKLAEVQKIEFPFIPDDPEEPFIITLNDKTVWVNQISGEIIQETKFPFTAVLEKLNIDLHTGRTNIIWAVILGLASLNIIFFIYSGFIITFKRTGTKIKNKFKAENAEIVILVGSENGSTLFFANQIHKQLLSDGKRSYLSEMNQYQTYPLAEHLLLFTSTYGLGDPPTNATKFEELLHKNPQQHPMKYSIVGFGSKAYTDFCAFSNKVDQLLSQYSWAIKFTDVYSINDRSTSEFISWVQDWSEKSLIPLATAPTLYSSKIPALKKFTVIEKTSVTADNSTFKVLLKSNQKFQSGDLLAIYPAQDNRERFYSIGKCNNTIQLIVKLFPDGLGSSFLYNLSQGKTIQGRIIPNPIFHFPKNASKVAMIANGTGIAPFLGMVNNNVQKIPVTIYAGFRYNNELIKEYQNWATQQKEALRLNEVHFAFSREQNKQYVMDLIARDEAYFVDLLTNSGVIMICGALQMQKDVEAKLAHILTTRDLKSITYYKENNQILTDCY